jgi:hypothetical protein
MKEIIENCWITRDSAKYGWAERGCIVWTGYHNPPVKGNGSFSPPPDDYETFKRNQIYIPTEKFPNITYRNKPKKCRIIIEIDEEE